MVPLHLPDLRSQMRRVVDGSLSLGKFEAWMSVLALRMHSDSASNAIDLASDVQLVLAARDDGVIDLDDIKAEFATLLGPAVIQFSIGDLSNMLSAVPSVSVDVSGYHMPKAARDIRLAGGHANATAGPELSARFQLAAA